MGLSESELDDLDLVSFNLLVERYNAGEKRKAERDAIFLSFIGNAIKASVSDNKNLFKPEDFLKGDEKKEEKEQPEGVMSPEEMQKQLLNIVASSGGKIEYVRD